MGLPAYVVRAAAKEPMGALTTVGFGAMALPEELKRRKELAKAVKPLIQETAAELGAPTMTRYAAAREDLQELSKIQRVLEKRAAAIPGPITGEMLGKALALSLAATAMGAGAAITTQGIGAVTNLVNQAQGKKRFAAVLKADPELKTEPKARAFFDILNKASPYIASEPIIAAATIRSMIDVPTLHLDDRRLKDLLAVEKARQETRFPFLHGYPGRGVGIGDIKSVG